MALNDGLICVAKFDQDGDGYIDAHDLQITMTRLGEAMTIDEAKKMIKND